MPRGKKKKIILQEGAKITNDDADVLIREDEDKEERKPVPLLKMLVRSLYDIQVLRVNIGNRISKVGKSKDTLDESVKTRLEQRFDELKIIEANLKADVERELQNQPIYAKYLEGIKGCGTAMSGIVVSEIENILRFATISKLWSYSGYGFKNGHIQKRTKGEKSNWNSFLKTKLFILGDCLIRNGNEHYRKLYDDYKHRIESVQCTSPKERHGEKHADGTPIVLDSFGCTPGHRHMKAKRYMIKMFLKDLYLKWYEIVGVKPRPPYAEEYLGKKHSE